MKIHIVHSTNYDYKNELYLPLRYSKLNNLHHIFLPHEADNFINTKVLLSKCDLVIAEVSYPSIGLGIELGWADSFNKTIICIAKKGSKTSASINTVSKTIIEYSTTEELLSLLTEYIEYKMNLNKSY